MTTDATRAKTARARRNRPYPLRVRLQGGRVVHAACTDRVYIDGAGITSCLTPFEPGDEQLAAGTVVTCAACKRRKGVGDDD